MALEESFSESDAPSPTSSNNEVPLAIPRRAFQCPICLDTIEEETSVSWCRHTFCFPCILEWACIRPVCPVCQEPFEYLFRKVGDNNYKVYYTDSSRHNRGRRDHRHSAERRRHRSAGHQHHRSPSGERSSSRARDWERHQSRTRWRNHDGHSRGQQARSYNPSSSRRWQHSRAQDTASETSSTGDRAARHGRDVPVRLGRSEHSQRAQWDFSRESRATRSQSQRRSHSAWRQTHREEQRRRYHNEGQPARPEQDVPDSSRRSEHGQQAQQDSSRESRATRSRFQRRSHSAWRQTHREEQRRRYHNEGQPARPEQDVPDSLGRSEHGQQAQQDSSRESQATRSRFQRRSHSAWRQTHREEQRRRDHNEGQPARPEPDVPDSLGRSEHGQQAQQDSSREPQATRSRSH